VLQVRSCKQRSYLIAAPKILWNQLLTSKISVKSENIEFRLRLVEEVTGSAR